MRNTLPAFMGQLAAVIVALDPNIGAVYQVQQRWRTDTEVENAGVVTIVAPSILDESLRASKNALRFWTLSGHSEPRPLTNESSEYRNQVLVTPFYQWEEGSSQETTLLKSCLELLDVLHLRETENVTLNTGPGYLGFLEERPRMQSHVLSAEISDTKIKGHTCPMTVTYFEEIPHA